MAAPTPVTITENGNGPYGQTIRVGPHVYTADEPESLGGHNSGPTPIEHLAAALGGCTLATVRMYARRKNMPIPPLTITVSKTDGQFAFHRLIKPATPLTAEMREKIMEMANKCPVHKMMEAGCTITTDIIGA